MTRIWMLLIVLGLTVCGCGVSSEKVVDGVSQDLASPADSAAPAVMENGEPSFITVQHVLIGFEGSVPGKGITRTKEEAEALAKEVLAKAQAGEDFLKLVEQHTDDSPPGIYKMANFGVKVDRRPASPADMVAPRAQMVAAFGDTGFPLQVGETGLAEFDTKSSPYGWHVVKRIE